MFPQTSPHPHILIQLLLLRGCLIPHITCPLVTDPHLRPARRKDHHISKVNPNIEDNPYKESDHWCNHLVSPYYVPGRDSSQDEPGEIKHIKCGHCPDTSSSTVSGILSHVPPPFFVYSQEMPCQYSLLKMDPTSTTLQGVVLGWPSLVAQDRGVSWEAGCLVLKVGQSWANHVSWPGFMLRVLQKWTLILAITQQGKGATERSKKASKAGDLD